MGGIMASPPTYRPLWHFEVIGTINEWQWEPPTSAAERRIKNEKRKGLSLANLKDKLFKWLEASDFDKPFLQPPTDTSPACEVPALLEEDVTKPGPAPPAEIADRIAMVRSEICQTTVFNRKKLDAWKNCICSLIGRKIRVRRITTAEVMLAMDPLDTITKQHMPRDKAHILTSQVQRYIISSLSAVRKKDESGKMLEPWLALVDRVLAIDTANHGLRLLSYLVGQASPTDLALLPLDRMLKKAQAFLIIQSNRMDRCHHWLQRMALFTKMMQSLDLVKQAAIQSGMTAFVQKRLEQTTGEQARQLEFCWLLLQAHGESLSPEAFETALQRFLYTHEFFRGMEAWQLATARFTGMRVIDETQHQDLIQKRTQSIEERWTLWAAAVLESGQGDALKGFCNTVRLMERSDSLARALVSSHDGRYGEAASRVIKHIVSGGNFDHGFMWDGIKAQQKAIMTRAEQGDVDTEIKSLLAVVDKMAKWYQTSPHLRDRQAQRGVEQCLRTHRSITGCVSPAILSSLLKVFLRDLEKGELGRTSRLQHLVRVIEQEQGVEEANKARRMIDDWRSVIRRRGVMADPN
jgi:hypothetical protein